MSASTVRFPALGHVVPSLKRYAFWLACTATAGSALATQGSTPLGICEARSGSTAPVVVELYTSEGCNSCPPADRWLSSLKGRGDVVALAFHVDYWDRLGWKDRFASPAYTERQQQVQTTSGARFSYTPQIVVAGSDWRRWPGTLPAAAASTVDVSLTRSGSHVAARISPRPGAPVTLSGYWAVLEDGLQSDVKAGENSGVLLHHDHVVRAYQPLLAWPGQQPHALSFEVPSALPRAPAGSARRTVLVINDARSARPVQAVALGC